MAGQSFDHLNPPAAVHNPTAIPAAEFPRHVHKFAGLNDDGTAKLNTFKVVNGPTELEAALDDGWSLTPVLTAPVIVAPVDPVVPVIDPAILEDPKGKAKK